MPSPAAPMPCIIDCDPGVDDVLAVLLALSSPELLVVAITVTHGNCTRDCALLNLQKTFSALEQHLDQRPSDRPKWPGVDVALRKRLGYGPIEVYLGSEGPIEGTAVTASYFHGRDGLSDLSTRSPSWGAGPSPFYHLSNQAALDGVSSLVSSSPPSTLAYVALGPLTTLAHLEALDQSLLSKLAVILVMGGAVDAPGNTSPVAEFNTYADPYAAARIFALRLPHLFLFPLDLTGNLTLPFAIYKSLVDSSFDESSSTATGLTAFTSAFLDRVAETMRRYGSIEMELHDPAVIYGLIHYARERQALPSSGGSAARRRIEEGGFARSEMRQRSFGGEVELAVVDAGLFAPGWRYDERLFDVETGGALTRGMLVVDRRASATAPAGLSTRQTNRALDLEESAAREREGESGSVGVRSGARVVVESPGSETLRALMLERIWGLRIGLV